jgi:hypothetical protein
MKRFLIKLALFTFIHLGLVAGAFAIYIARFPPSQSYYAASIDKHRLLQTQPSPRLIFVGGSSMALGMDSALVAKPLGFHPVNMAYNIGVGLEFMLDEIEGALKPGDVVLVAPEYHTFQKYYPANPEYVARLVECHPGLLKALPFQRWKELTDHGYVHHLGRVLRTAFSGKPRGIYDNSVNQFHSREAFNEYGDIVAHHGVEIKRGMPLRFELTSPATAQRAIERLNDFHRKCRRRGVRVFFSHPPYERRFFNRYRRPIEQLETMLRSKLTIPMLDTPEEMTFPSDHIFDVEYHLNLQGKITRSQRVAQSLRTALSNSN